MVRPHSAALAALLVLGWTSLAGAQTAGDSITSQDVNEGESTVAADTSGLAQEIALQDSARATLAQDQDQTQVDQARLDSLQSMLKLDRESSPHAAAVVAQTKREVHRDLERDRHAQARLASIEKRVKKEQAPSVKKPAKGKTPPHHAPGSD